MKSNNHYELAFREMLQRQNISYVEVNEAHKSAFANVKLKSFDFIIYLPQKNNLIVEVKGRKSKPSPKHSWLFDPWVSSEDIHALKKWQYIFGNTFQACFIFAFWLSDNQKAITLSDSFEHKSRFYKFYGIYLDDYCKYAKTRSTRWNTVTIARTAFLEYAFDFSMLINA